jgi:hypothetical protein
MHTVQKLFAGGIILTALIAAALSGPLPSAGAPQQPPSDKEGDPKKPAVAGEGDDLGKRAARPEDIARWIRELGEKDFQVREKATKALEEVGEPAVKALTEAARSTDPEVQRRVKLLLEQIEINEAVAPTLVALRLRDVPVPEAVEKLGKQSRLKLTLVPQQGPGREQLEQKRITLDLQRVPFWEALERLCETANLSYVPFGVGTLQLQSLEGATPGRVPTAFSGSFRLRVTNMHYSRNLSFATGAGVVQPQFGGFQPPAVAGAPSRQEQLLVSFDVIPESHVKILALGTMELTAAEDENGQSLLTEGRGAQPAYYQQGYYNGPGLLQPLVTQTSLRPSSKPAAKLKVLKGTLPVELLAQRRPMLQVDNPLTSKEKIFKGENNLTLVILGTQNQGPQQGNVRFALTGVDRKKLGEIQQHPGFPGGRGYFDANLLRPFVELTDAAGRPLNLNLNLNVNYNGGDGQEDMLEGNFYYSPGPDTGPPTRLVFYNPKRIRTSVSFEFRNVPMP